VSEPPALAALELGGPAEPWTALGFAADGERIDAGGVALRLHGDEPPGLRGWALRGVPAGTDLAGIPCAEPPSPPPAAAAAHPNGVDRIDHVVLMTPNLRAALDELEAAGLTVRRVREAGDTGLRQAFLIAGGVLLEVVGDVEGDARLWGITFVVPDVDALAAARPAALGTPRDAVQPGRRIVTAREDAGLGVPVAFMTPRA
jgi:hypothetical protein